MEEHYNYGHGIGDSGSEYVRIPDCLIGAFYKWLEKLGAFNAEAPQKRAKKVRNSRTLLVLYLFIYNGWVKTNRQSIKGENKPFTTNYPEIQKNLFIERHSAHKLLEELKEMKFISVDYDFTNKGAYKTIIKININMEERDKIIKYYLGS